MNKELVQISKTVSRALRHQPEAFGLELDEAGWTGLDQLLAAVSRGRPAPVTEAQLHEIIAASEKKRFEIDGRRIRARYGHSVPGQVVAPIAEPPAVLFHGTTPQAWERIRVEGLRPMRRQYVHLSAEIYTAVVVARRRTKTPVILSVDTAGVRARGGTFHVGTDQIWLTGPIAPGLLQEHQEQPTD